LDSGSLQPHITSSLTAGFHMSACCRREVYLNRGQRNPNCPGCGTSTEWVVTVRSGGDPRRHVRQEERNETYAAYAVFNGGRVANVRILNHSARGIAIELGCPAALASEARIYFEGFSAPLGGFVRHCTTTGVAYAVGIEIPGEWNHELLLKSGPGDHRSP
jgi:hypothetical protein